MTNADLENLVDTTDEWIVSRTGIKERRIAEDDQEASDMAVEAASKALEMAGWTPEDVELIIVATVTPDFRLPSTACVIQQKMGLVNAAAFDVVAACAGFINSLSIAQSYIAAGMYKRILAIGVEKLSAFTNYKDRNTCVLFGDGAGAVTIGASTNGSGVLSSFIKSDGTMQRLIWSEVGGTTNPYTADYAFDGSDKIMMNGADVFKIAVREMSNAANKVLEDAGLSTSDISLIVPHQANIRIIEALAKRLHVDMDIVYMNISKYGNTSAASVPLALDEANREGRIKSGDYILIVAFGGGLTWGSAVIRW